MGGVAGSAGDLEAGALAVLVGQPHAVLAVEDHVHVVAPIELGSRCRGLGSRLLAGVFAAAAACQPGQSETEDQEEGGAQEVSGHGKSTREKVQTAGIASTEVTLGSRRNECPVTL